MDMYGGDVATYQIAMCEGMATYVCTMYGGIWQLVTMPCGIRVTTYIRSCGRRANYMVTFQTTWEDGGECGHLSPPCIREMAIYHNTM